MKRTSSQYRRSKTSEVLNGNRLKYIYMEQKPRGSMSTLDIEPRHQRCDTREPPEKLSYIIPGI